jgi:hypothetical protein
MGSGAGSAGLGAGAAPSVGVAAGVAAGVELGALCVSEGAFCPKDGRATSARNKNGKNRSRMRTVNLLAEGLIAYRPFFLRIRSVFRDLLLNGSPVFQLVGEKVLASRGRVQLIVFFAAIREILKKEIYRRDKERLGCYENKRQVPAMTRVKTGSREFGAFGLWMHIRLKVCSCPKAVRSIDEKICGEHPARTLS